MMGREDVEVRIVCLWDFLWDFWCMGCWFCV